jgi:hypothetical protein
MTAGRIHSLQAIELRVSAALVKTPTGRLLNGSWMTLLQCRKTEHGRMSNAAPPQL